MGAKRERIETRELRLLLELLKHPDAYEIVSFETNEVAPPSYLRQMAREWALT